MSDLETNGNTSTGNEGAGNTPNTSTTTGSSATKGNEGNVTKSEHKKSFTKQTVTQPQTQNDPNTQDELRRLRSENKARRLQIESLETRVNEVLQKAETATAQTAQFKKNYEQSLIDASLEIAAAKHGLQDIDAFKMADLSTLQVAENGKVLGVDEVLEKFKTEKPYLFKTPTSTSSNVRVPETGDQNKKVSLLEVDQKAVDKGLDDLIKGYR